MLSADGRPIVAVTNGDPCGIGPEIVAKALTSDALRAGCVPVVIGSPEAFARILPVVDSGLTLREIGAPAEARGEAGTVEIVAFDRLDIGQCPFGEISAEAGRYSGLAIAQAIALAMEGQVHSVVVAPNNKRAMSLGGHEHTGFDEICRHYTGTSRSVQILMGQECSLARVTNHVPLRAVADLCTRDKVLSVIRILRESLETAGVDDPVIGVAGLNPHCGEEGLIGTEEMTDIGPACDDARAEGIRVVGPIPPDTVFVDRHKLGLDVVLSMYHDHGNTGIKLLEFGHLTNFVGGLPVPVFTVSHGTAFDIAGKGVADSRNIELSIAAAARSRRAEQDPASRQVRA